MADTGSLLRDLMAPVPLSVAVTFAAFTLLWLVSIRVRDASIVDRYWAAGFVVIGWVVVAFTGMPGAAGLAFFAALHLWAARLGVYLWLRHRAMRQEDPRYAAIRATHQPGFAWKSLFMIFWVQAAVMCLVAAPVYAVLLRPAETVAAPLFALGLAVFAVGLIIETVADAQLARFRSRPENHGRLLRTGLWGYSRHPHYFGESLVWTGLGIAAIGLSGAWWALAGPALLTLLLLKVSGIPPLERHLGTTRPDYGRYRAEVNAFIPGPPRREAGETAEGQLRSPAE